MLNNYNKFYLLQVKVLITCGGRDVRAHVNNMLRHLLDDTLAQQFTLTGKSLKNVEKKSFLDTEVSRLLLCKLLFLYEIQKVRNILMH